MNEIITSSDFAENTISVSRNYQEALNIKQGHTAYGVVSSLIATNIDAIDSFAELLGQLAAAGVVKKLYDDQHFNPKYGNFKNFFTRNIYLDPVKKEGMEMNRNIAGAAAMLGTEAVVKLASRGIQYLANEKDKFQTLYKIYSVLYCYANSDNANNEKARVELSKIRNSFPLSQANIVRLKNKVEKENIRSLGDLDFGMLYNMDNSYLENISYLLYSIHCQKYGELAENREDKLLDYYDAIGYRGNIAKALISENRSTYNTISNDQRKYLAVARGMVNNMFVDFPVFDMNRISQTASEMAKYDPYAIRRKKVSTATKAGGLTVAGLFAKNPKMIMSAASEALSLFKIDDDGMEAARIRLKGWDIDEKAISQIFKQGESLQSKANEIISLEKSE